MSLITCKKSYLSQIVLGLAFFSFLILSGCSNPFGHEKSYVDPNYGTAVPAEPVVPAEPAATGYEVVSGSHLSKVSASGQRKVDVTVGAPTSQMRLVTSKNKIIYLSVQGQIGSN